jgi:chromate transport protein ChrA
MNFREYLVATIFFILLIFGPVDHSSTYGIAIRTLSIVLTPIISFIILNYIWKRTEPNEKVEILLSRVLSVLISIFLFIIAFKIATHKQNIESLAAANTNVSNEIFIENLNYKNASVVVFFALFFLWLGIVKLKSNKKNSYD